MQHRSSLFVNRVAQSDTQFFAFNSPCMIIQPPGSPFAWQEAAGFISLCFPILTSLAKEIHITSPNYASAFWRIKRCNLEKKYTHTHPFVLLPGTNEHNELFSRAAANFSNVVSLFFKFQHTAAVSSSICAQTSQHQFKPLLTKCSRQER